ncbi:hypothetical protein LUZ61_002160 [Rhynchospora tenuis]|uniref:Uncharacterized protein n=1 Tax=Rhynchospora tenuis TaxID=198213 RepID=A0AAD6ERN0_9POAL|nr:hypothetical protein LUZ61_002160 [Rhynchospora tenuis]
MAWWRKKVVFPVKRALAFISARLRSRRNCNGIMKLYDDVQTCEYKDVQVLWEILRLEMEVQTPQSHQRSIWRVPTWQNRSRRGNRIIT